MPATTVQIDTNSFEEDKEVGETKTKVRAGSFVEKKSAGCLRHIKLNNFVVLKYVCVDVSLFKSATDKLYTVCGF